MKNRLSLTVGALFLGCVCSIKAGIREDLEAANQIPDEQWVEKAKAFTEAFENLKLKLQEQWRIQLGEGECELPVNGVYPNSYEREFFGPRGAVREDSPVWLGCWLSGHVLGHSRFNSLSFISDEKRKEIETCCGPYWWEAICCNNDETWWCRLFTDVISLGIGEVINCFVHFDDKEEEATAFLRHVKHVIKDFILEEFNVTKLQEVGHYLQRHFCTPIANLILKISQEEVVWTKDNLIPLLKLYASYVESDGGYGYQKNFTQHKYSEIREIVHNFIIKTICSSGNGNEELNVWLCKQLANWKKDPYSSLAGIGQYQIEIEFLFDIFEKTKAQESVDVSSNLQSVINIVTNEVDLNKQKRELENQRRANINAAYMMGVEMRSGAGVY